ncbi:hypothetical protein GCM10010112_55950 [Actinoplanes lobatus]|uniref:Uncharacterized protein n=1 Tax=Actinoplanes lobatus TaxID=113568 RepID=A0A7W7HER2_9ACTN|nr:hypothetical protein [Actinoplanes lobatus]MBB4749185.1 hypothetical protein [Actinoplanes lobatus]GGN80418.1 hypothetical protein GCM10010112_55950 [Actinoplanes lobatus]GIE45255.1 hypothetical protein Alo02nite_81530 [Actinoplanes lobatus]
MGELLVIEHGNRGGDLERISLQIGNGRRQLAITVTADGGAQLVGDCGGWMAGEHGANRAVEVDQEAPSKSTRRHRVALTRSVRVTGCTRG